MVHYCVKLDQIFDIQIIFAYIALFSSLCLSASSTYNFTVGNTTLPRGDKMMGVALNPNNGTILLFGGYFNRQQFVQFDPQINQFIDVDTLYLNKQCFGKGQFYNQIENALWMIKSAGNGFIQVNVQTYDVAYPDIQIPINVGGMACLASMDPYLFVVGGSNADKPLQIYNITSGLWVNGPSLQTKRDTLACIVVNEKLYAIAGRFDSITFLDTVEVLNVGGDLQSAKWTEMADRFNDPIVGSRVVQYGGNIIIIGGWNGTIDISDVYIIDTTTQTLSIASQSPSSYQPYISTSVPTLSLTIETSTKRTTGDATDPPTKELKEGQVQTEQTKIYKTTNDTVYKTDNPSIPLSVILYVAGGVVVCCVSILAAWKMFTIMKRDKMDAEIYCAGGNKMEPGQFMDTKHVQILDELTVGKRSQSKSVADEIDGPQTTIGHDVSDDAEEYRNNIHIHSDSFIVSEDNIIANVQEMSHDVDSDYGGHKNSEWTVELKGRRHIHDYL